MSTVTSELNHSVRSPARRRRSARPTLLNGGDLLLLLGANVVVIVGLWARAGGLRGLGDPAVLLTSVGRVTGLVGTYLVLVQLVMLARVPSLERTFGFDSLTIWHRRNGKLCLSLLLAHAVLITWGYMLSDRISLPGEVSRLITSTAGILTATVGLALLIAVVCTSIVIVRRRLAYETWYFVHLYSYLGIALAFSHQLADGNDFIGDPLARSYWYALYFATLGALVVWRIVMPIARGLRHRLRIERVVEEAPGVVSLYVAGRDLDRLAVQSGQFFMWRLLTWQDWWRPHPFSLSAAPDGRRLRLTVKALGDDTARIARVRPGTRVLAEGPYGAFTAERRSRRRAAFIAGGVGITPIRALLEDMPAGRGDLTLVYRAIDRSDLIFRDELERLATARGIEVHYVLGDHRDKRHRSLLAPRHLAQLVPDIAQRDVFVCGPPAMADGVRASLRRAGVPRSQIHVERFAL